MESTEKEIINIDDNDDEHDDRDFQVTGKEEEVKKPLIIDIEIENDDDKDIQIITCESPNKLRRLTNNTLTTKRRRNFFGCKICLEDDLSSHQGYTIDKCNHRFCISCLTGLIVSSLTSGSASSLLNNVVCPHDQCKTILTNTDIQFILRDNPSYWKAFSEKLNLGVLEMELADKNSGTRRCPSEHCNYIFVFDTRTTTAVEGRQFDCPMCEENFCLQCGANDGKVGPAHIGISCYDRKEQLTQQKVERRKFRQWQNDNAQADQRFNAFMKKENIKRCRRCGNGVELASGCLKVKCRCGYKWCFNCGTEDSTCNCTPSSHVFFDNKKNRPAFS